MKKSILLCVCLALLTTAFLSSCGDSTENTSSYQYSITEGTDGIDYELNETGDGYIVTGFRSIDNELIIPELYEGKPVVEIGESAFEFNEFDKITLPRSLKKIGKKAFFHLVSYEEDGLDTLIIPEGVEEIGEDAFWFCPFKEITLPSTLKIIGERAFALNSNLNKFILNESDYFVVKNNVLYSKDEKELIHYPAGIKKNSFDVPSTVENILDYAIYNNPNLTNINFSSNSELKQIGVYGIACLTIEQIDLTILKNLTIIKDFAFSENSLKSITIPETVTSMGEGLFKKNASLLVAKFNNTFTALPNRIFEDCYRLTSVTYKNSEQITSIGDNAFKSCGLTKIDFPKNLVLIGERAYYANKGLTSLSFPSSLQTIGNNAFTYCSNITSIAFPSSLKTIGERAFVQLELLDNIDLSITKVETIGEVAFLNCSAVKSVSFPKTLKSIGKQAFQGLSNIETIALNEGLESIGENAFIETSKVYKVYIPKSIKSFGNYVFGSYQQNKQTLNLFFEDASFDEVNRIAYGVSDNNVYFNQTLADFTAFTK